MVVRVASSPGQRNERFLRMILSECAVIVTGGASGLGAATARALRDRGAAVTIFDRDTERGPALASEIGAAFAEVDVTDEASVVAGIALARARMGRISGLVNCAGVVSGERIVGRKGPHALDTFRRTIDINLNGSFNTLRLAAAAMADNDGPARGVIVNTASVAAYDGQKGQPAYAASKGAIAALTLPAARDLASLGIRVCAIAPGLFATPMLESLPADLQATLAADVTYPKRLGDPQEFAALVCFIFECDYLNGEVIRLDGALRMQ
jgi:NAD(P)-dependent dehydrogenase (short-subunit alcohol dehydrogenase family)